MKSRDRLFNLAENSNCDTDLIMAIFDNAIQGMREQLGGEGGPTKLSPLQQLETDRLREIFKNIGVTAGEAIKNFNSNIESLNAVASEPKHIQGYTAEQWQEIIDGGYLCQFSEDGEAWTRGARCLGDTDHSTSLTFAEGRTDTTMWWKFCRPAQIKGVMRPIFVEPVNDPYCVFFDLDGKAMHSGMMMFSLRYSYDFKGSNHDRMPTKYIEV